jgi:hypothetical protein
LKWKIWVPVTSTHFLVTVGWLMMKMIEALSVKFRPKVPASKTLCHVSRLILKIWQKVLALIQTFVQEDWL